MGNTIIFNFMLRLFSFGIRESASLIACLLKVPFSFTLFNKDIVLNMYIWGKNCFNVLNANKDILPSFYVTASITWGYNCLFERLISSR